MKYETIYFYLGNSNCMNLTTTTLGTIIYYSNDNNNNDNTILNSVKHVQIK